MRVAGHMQAAYIVCEASSGTGMPQDRRAAGRLTDTCGQPLTSIAFTSCSRSLGVTTQPEVPTAAASPCSHCSSLSSARPGVKM
jgi:hypothetical protein